MDPRKRITREISERGLTSVPALVGLLRAKNGAHHEFGDSPEEIAATIREIKAETDYPASHDENPLSSRTKTGETITAVASATQRATDTTTPPASSSDSTPSASTTQAPDSKVSSTPAEPPKQATSQPTSAQSSQAAPDSSTGSNSDAGSADSTATFSEFLSGADDDVDDKFEPVEKGTDEDAHDEPETTDDAESADNIETGAPDPSDSPDPDDESDVSIADESLL